MAASAKKKKIKVIDITSGVSERIELRKKKSDESAGKPAETERVKAEKIKTERDEDIQPKRIDIEKEIPSRIKPLATKERSAEFFDFNKKSSKDIENEEILERIENRHIPEKHRHKKHPSRRGVKFYIFVILFLALIGVGVYFSVTVLPKADVAITAKTIPWDYSNALITDSKIAEIDVASRKIPSAIFTESKNQAFDFPASGRKFLESKAQGRITIYNEFGPANQILVANTRFETPDGKIFRLKERAVVPGTTKDSATGEIIPGSLDVVVIADKAGDEYNIGPVPRFSIPGFAGSARFDKFYARSTANMAGGFIGDGKYATKEDIDNAKNQAEAKMKETVLSFLKSQAMPDGFKIIGSNDQVKIIKTQVIDAVDEAGNFKVFVDAQASMEAIKEEQVLELITALARQAIGQEYVIKQHTLNYGQLSVVSAGKGKDAVVNLPVEFKGIFWKPLKSDLFKASIAGKGEKDLKNIVFTPENNIEKIDLTLWPFWVKSIPKNIERIKMEIK